MVEQSQARHESTESSVAKMRLEAQQHLGELTLNALQGTRAQ